MTASTQIWKTQMPRAADKPHQRAILFFVLVILILLAFTVKWDLGDLCYIVFVVGISTYISSLTDERGLLFMLSHPGQEIRIEGQNLKVITLKTNEVTSYPLDEFQAYEQKSIFSDWGKKFYYDVIGNVHLIPKDRYRFTVKILKVRDYKGLGEALRVLGLEDRS